MGSDTGRSKSSLDQFSALFFSSTSGSAGLSRQSTLTHTVEWEILRRRAQLHKVHSLTSKLQIYNYRQAACIIIHVHNI